MRPASQNSGEQGDPNARLLKAVPKFTCQRCGESASRIYRSGPALDLPFDAVRRVHICLFCGYRFRTLEQLED